MKRVIAFIPARGGSTSIPKKNIKDFCGRPLIFWNLNELNVCNEVNEVWVATDSEEIAHTVLSFNLPKVKIFHRSPENAQDHSSTESVILEFLSKKTFDQDTIFILSQATSPFTLSIHFLEGIKALTQKHNDSVLSVVRKKSFYWNDEGLPMNYDYTKRPRRQNFKGILQENGAFYISSVGNILKSQNRLSGKIGFVEMPEYTSIELDEQEDWELASFYMQNKVLNKTRSDKKIKMLVTDVDGVLTDAGMYYSEKGDELKKFNTRDGMGFEMLRKSGIKTAIITSEKTKIVENRGIKMNVDYLNQGLKNTGKLNAIQNICQIEEIDLSNVAYIGDDINCLEALNHVGMAACPSDAMKAIKEIPGIIILKRKGGEGVVREFIEEFILE
jgi:N-acylneuraminate cytidylyltransferase